MSDRSFFAELKRRNVYKVAVAYMVAAWALAQGLAQVLPVFDVPNWAVRTLIVLLVLGFPLALSLAWVYEITPEGIKRTQDVDPKKSIRRRTGRKLVALTIGLAAVALAITIIRLPHARESADSWQPSPAAGTITIPDKSIAVLPFENLSDEKSNAYFVDGIQDEILTRLSKIASLKVISRTSTQKYKSAPENLRAIGKELGVAYLLEGSVQKIGNAVHISVQLLRAVTDEHIWAESYNRKLDDVFAVEGEVAGAIAEQLKAKLSGKEKQEVTAKPTSNPEAYDAYLRGLAFFDHEDLASAAQFFEKAVQLDPNFVIAWGRVARVHSYMFFNGDSLGAHPAAAREALNKALQLQPDLVETRLDEALYHYWVERDYDRARQIFEQVRQESPNNSEAPWALALIARRQARWDESLSLFRDALELDPRNLRILIDTSDTYQTMRQFQASLKLLDRALDIAPNDRRLLGRKVAIYQALGALDQSEAVLERVPVEPNESQGTWDIFGFAVAQAANQLILKHNYQAGVTQFQSFLSKLDPTGQAERRPTVLMLLGRFQQLAGDEAGAKASYAQARDELETLARQQPENVDFISSLALVQARLGNKEAALEEANRAIAKLPTKKDAIAGPAFEEVRARVLALTGDKENAVAALQHLLVTPYVGVSGVPLTPALLRLDPDWDSLRNDPRFEKLCQEKSK